MLKFTTLAAALAVAAMTTVTVHLPSASHVRPALAFHPAPPSRFVASENADQWQQAATKQQADEDAARAAAEAKAAEEARQAELARAAELARQQAAAVASRPVPAQPAAVPAGSVQEIIVRAFSPYGQTLAVASERQEIAFWDPATGKKLSAIKTPQTPQCLAYTPDGKSVVAVCGERWELEVLGLGRRRVGLQVAKRPHLNPPRLAGRGTTTPRPVRRGGPP